MYFVSFHKTVCVLETKDPVNGSFISLLIVVKDNSRLVMRFFRNNKIVSRGLRSKRSHMNAIINYELKNFFNIY